MQSVFQRRAFSQAVDTGTRPGLHGRTLISSGLNDLDRILQGGLPLGSVLLIVEDAHSHQHFDLMRYFLSEGVACSHNLCWMMATLPESGAEKAILQQQTKQDPGQASSDQGRPGQEGELRIAWQYRKYIQKQQQDMGTTRTRTGAQERTEEGSRPSEPKVGASPQNKAVLAGVSRQWCHNFNLTRTMEAGGQLPPNLATHVFSGPSAYQKLGQIAGSFIATHGGSAMIRSPSQVGRLVIQSLGSPAWLGEDVARVTEEEHAAMVLRLVVVLTQRLQDARCAALVTCPARCLPPHVLQCLHHLCQVVLVIDSLSDNSPVYRLLPDKTTATALMSVVTLPGGPFGTKPPSGPLMVIRNKRRYLTITPVEVDPDAEAQEAKKGSDKSRSAAASMCGGPPGASKTIDF